MASVLLVVLAAVVACCAAQLPQNFTTALDEYIALPDASYSYYDTVRSWPT